MNKLELGKCELLMEKAIILAKQSEAEGKEAEKYTYLNNYDEIQAQILLRKADQHYGEAVGIEMALTVIGFKHDRMKELSGML